MRDFIIGDRVILISDMTNRGEVVCIDKLHTRKTMLLVKVKWDKNISNVISIYDEWFAEKELKLDIQEIRNDRLKELDI